MKITVHKFIAPWGAEIKAGSREGTIDWNTLTSCITQDEYRVARLPLNGVAIDVGGYVGACSLALASRGYKVFCIEPIPENNILTRENIEINHFQDKIALLERAMTSKKDEYAAIHYYNTSSELGKQHEFIGMPLNDKRAGRAINVKTITLEQIFTENKLEKIDFLKIDIEGGEWDIFKNIPEYLLDKIDRIALEIDGVAGVPTSTTKFLKLLKDKFVDYSREYFPDWCAPGMSVHGYYRNKKI
jgi:FkbM family methyltransferase